MKKIPQIHIRHKIRSATLVAVSIIGVSLVGYFMHTQGVWDSTSANALGKGYGTQKKQVSTESGTSHVQEQSQATPPSTSDNSGSPAPTPANTTISPQSSASPRGIGLYVNPTLISAGRPSAIANQPTATWLGGWSGDVQTAAHTVVSAATAQGTLATLVAYNIPGRDCGNYSAGGSATSESYKLWIRQLAAGIGARKAIVIIEPDALSLVDCLNSTEQNARYTLIADAVNVLTAQTNAFVYLDAGHSGWISAATMASRLTKANISQARGFALNVSNFMTTAESTAYGNQLSSATGKSFVIDTGRNGNGSNGEWCNPRGRALGANPTTSVGGNVDAYLWVKVPGESDGTCNGGPSAGSWWNDYALELISSR